MSINSNVRPKVSVLIPVYNSADTLERCIRSALWQTLANIEILVADDGSTDDSAAIAERLAAVDPRVRVMRIWPNGGKPAAMNRMVAVARGTWIAVLDADDAYHAQRLERLVEEADLHGVEMAADNLFYVDAGADCITQTAFEPDVPARILTKSDMLQNSDSYATFDFGILKPLIKRSFLLANGLSYFEKTRLAEDFYYLMGFFVAGGRGVLVSDPLYYWTMPFGSISRTWTSTGSGAWRYDYRQALTANAHFIRMARGAGDADTVTMLQARSAQYRVMIHYLTAQRAASEGAWARCLWTIATHPSTYGLLLRRVWGRLAPQPKPGPRHRVAQVHPSLHAPSRGRAA